MKEKLPLSILLTALLCSCAATELLEPEYQGRFRKNRDLYLAHFDLKTDVDDIHSAGRRAEARGWALRHQPGHLRPLFPQGREHEQGGPDHAGDLDG